MIAYHGSEIESCAMAQRLAAVESENGEMRIHRKSLDNQLDQLRSELKECYRIASESYSKNVYITRPEHEDSLARKFESFAAEMKDTICQAHAALRVQLSESKNLWKCEYTTAKPNVDHYHS